MRSPNLGSVQYTPGPVPDDMDGLRRYVREELIQISAAITALAQGHLDAVDVAPTKPREGDIRLATGANWNPLGTGKRFVGYRGGAWVDLG